MGSKSDHLNFVLIPLMAPGHTIPMIDMAKLFAKRGVNITIILTPLDATRFRPVIERAVGSGLPIQLLQVKFPSEEAGLPPGCESADSLLSFDLMPNFFNAVTMLQKPMEEILKKLNPTPSCIICAKHLVWTVDTCKTFQIPRIVFDGMSCFTQLVTNKIYVSKIHERVAPEKPFIVPDLPDEIEFTKIQLPGSFNPGALNIAGFREQVRKTESQAYGMVVNSFEEVEQRYVDELRKVKKVWCIGPLSLWSNESLDIAQRGNNQDSINSDQFLNWLDSKKQGSVIYACLGSLSRLSTAQFIELALGLEESSHPFVLVVKTSGGNSEEIGKWILEEGFEERTKERGLLIRGWAPQVLILSHSAVGGFLTHCGWNSTLEGICSGLPMITWPMFSEQFLNEKLVVQILGTGVGVGARAVVHLGEEQKPEMKVMRNGITKAIQRVMDEGKEGCERRKMAKELGEKARRSVEVGGSSDLNARLLIQEIAQLGKSKQ
ncbi:hypothetical protein RD792_011994 [Penstemon davidsonii]|uniref:Glycosyltransferase n=1 Tax=Penstemon davidsonii TaxID=160366 RepID=A0ABR0CWL0_9LAMI|nr:hypothetical protein RD792_011994 [Penstemon davidsonii]